MAEKSLIFLKKENLELIKENEALKLTVSKLLEELTRIRGISDPSFSKKNLSLEESIIEEQIQYFHVMSSGRALSLEETRALDLLIKNKRLLQEKKPIEPDFSEVPEQPTESDLLRIAGNVENIVRIESEASSKDSVE